MATQKHTVEAIKPEIPIHEHLDLHEKGWVIQRIGWVLIFLIPILAALGLFGEGLLSSRKPQAGPYTAEYDRFNRYEKEMKIVVESQAGHIASIALPQDYVKHFRLVRIIPEPENNQAIGQNVVFSFLGNQNKTVSIYAIPQNYGTVKGTMQVNNQAFQLNHFIYP